MTKKKYARRPTAEVIPPIVMIVQGIDLILLQQMCLYMIMLIMYYVPLIMLLNLINYKEVL